MDSKNELTVKYKYDSFVEHFNGKDEDLDTLYHYKKKLMYADTIDTVQHCIKELEKIGADISYIAVDFMVYDDDFYPATFRCVYTKNGLFALNEANTLSNDMPYTYVKNLSSYIIMRDMKVINNIFIDTSYRYASDDVTDSLLCNDFNTMTTEEKEAIMDSVKAKELLNEINGKKTLKRDYHVKAFNRM